MTLCGLLALLVADLPATGEVVESVSSARGLGAVGGVVLIVLGLDLLRRRGVDNDLSAHEITKRAAIDHVGNALLAVLRSPPQSRGPQAPPEVKP